MKAIIFSPEELEFLNRAVGNYGEYLYRCGEDMSLPKTVMGKIQQAGCRFPGQDDLTAHAGL